MLFTCTILFINLSIVLSMVVLLVFPLILICLHRHLNGNVHRFFNMFELAVLEKNFFLLSPNSITCFQFTNVSFTIHMHPHPWYLTYFIKKIWLYLMYGHLNYLPLLHFLLIHNDLKRKGCFIFSYFTRTHHFKFETRVVSRLFQDMKSKMCTSVGWLKKVSYQHLFDKNPILKQYIGWYC